MTTLLCLLLLLLVLWVLGLVGAVAVMLAASRRADALEDDVTTLLERAASVELAECELVEGGPRAELLAERLRERYVVTLHSGETFDGLLVDVDERTVVMQDTSALGADGQAVPVDGQVILQRSNVAYLQRP